MLKELKLGTKIFDNLKNIGEFASPRKKRGSQEDGKRKGNH
jgi:hypothetical protein